MKSILTFFIPAVLLSACQANAPKTETASEPPKDSTSAAAPADLPFTASYTSNWNDNVSDADLKTVLTSYKDWADGNLQGLGKAFGDSVDVDMSDGHHFRKSNADLMKMWGNYRDSLSGVKMDFASWHKMYAKDKNDIYIVTWYDETDTYKNGKVDSATYHDINRLKDGKIVWYSQYKRVKK